MVQRTVVPRGRHAPPLAVRQDRQRVRLHEAAAAVFARIGYADATADLIAREAGMSKATFYEHFYNKEDCICALFDSALAVLLGALRAGEPAAGSRPAAGDAYRASIAALLETVAEHRYFAQTLFVEIIGAGPRAIARRDNFLADVAAYVDERNAQEARAGLSGRFASPHDAFAIVGAVAELVSRQIRTGVPSDIRELQPLVLRLVTGLLVTGEQAGAR